MARVKNLVGRTFGRWFVKSMVSEQRHGRVYWLCRCACGQTAEVNGTKLRQGLTRSCGCAPHKGQPVINMTGKRIGKWTVLGRGTRKRKSGALYWLCSCECGRQEEVGGDFLRHGQTQGCTTCHRYGEGTSRYVNFLRRIQQARSAKQATAQTPEAAPTKRAKIPLMAAARIEAERRFEKDHGSTAVRNSADLERILALPRREVPNEEALETMRREMHALLSNGVARGQGCRCDELAGAAWDGVPGSACIVELRPIQAWYLYEAMVVQGCLGAIAVGAGKTGIDILTPMVVPGCQQAALLIPPGLKAQFIADFKRWRQHFKVPNLRGEPGGGAGPNGEYIAGRPVLNVLKYSELSSPGFTRWFVDRPEITVVIADEAQALKDRKATRVGRFLDHFIQAAIRAEEGAPPTRFFCHTGSLTSRGLEDYSHLSALALGEGSPVPLEPSVVTAWGQALNPVKNGEPAQPGALLQLCEPGERVEEGFRRRFTETRGVVATFESSVPGVELRISVRNPPPIPDVVRDALKDVRNKALRPDGELLKEALEQAKTAREVACGFYLYWNFPGAQPVDFEPGGRIAQWKAKRKDWNREVRTALMNHVPEMDSEALLKKAAERALAGYQGDKPVWHSESWVPWRDVEKTLPHETRVNWLSDWLARDAAAWMHEMEAAGTAGIVWTHNPVLGALIAKLTGRPYFGQGKDAEVAIVQERGDRSIVASIPAHHRGRNLQHAFCANLFPQPPADAGIWEQTIGRTLRPGQRRPLVTVEIYQHVPELVDAFELAMGRAGYVKGTVGADQKLLAGIHRP